MLTKGSMMLLALACVVLFAGVNQGVPVSSVVSLPLHSMPSRTPSSIVRSMSFTPDPDDPVFGDVYPAAIFWLFIDVGNPSRSFPVAIDSGSYTLDIPSVGCSGCPTSQPNNQYDGSKSTTAKKVRCGFSCDGCSNGQCTFSNTYETCDLSNPTAPCTIAGNYYQDQVKVAGLGPVNVTFGAITSQTTNFDQFKIIDGVVGMAGPGGSSNVFQSLVDAKFLAHSIWSLCLVHGSKSNGTITLGGIDSRLVSGPIQYVPNLDGSDGMYTFKMKDIQVGGSSVLGGRTYKAILDTGTNVLLVPTPIFNSIRSSMQANCTQSNLNGVCNSGKTLFDGACFTFTDDQINAFPTLTLVLDGVKLSMAPSTYILPKDGDATNTYCLGIRPTGQDGFLIVGDTTIEPYLVVFDRENARIGWGTVNKDNCGSI